MKLIVGLGNPGKEYEKTRHNFGFRVIDYYAEKEELVFNKKFKSLYAEKMINNEKIIFLKPQTYMNESGEAVLKCMNYYKINNEDILIIYDDMDLPLGNYKLKSQGSSAGHNGIRNIIELLKTENIKRLRMGISKNDNNKIDYVLGTFSKEEEKLINDVILTSYDIINDYLSISFDKLMNKYNKG